LVEFKKLNNLPAKKDENGALSAVTDNAVDNLEAINNKLKDKKMEY